MKHPSLFRRSLKVAVFAAAIALPLANAPGAKRGRDASGFQETMGLAEEAKLGQ